MQILNERMKARGQGGFTLIELLVVIGVLAVLAGVVVFAVGGVTDSAEEQACATEQKTIETALEAFRADTDAYPTAAQGLTILAPTYLREDPTANWTYNPPAAGGNVIDATLEGAAAPGRCVGFT